MGVGGTSTVPATGPGVLVGLGPFLFVELHRALFRWFYVVVGFRFYYRVP